ncbi:hypothetical protein [Streptomyces sp. TRM49041]|uniref:hypothetical protein n=1 Tax=Streptomyces sp. TRM49041 TaxID=2603216 RepID=UPI001656896E|nr:hypothetical protein [Streptomyces sp. TRM49041]
MRGWLLQAAGLCVAAGLVACPFAYRAGRRVRAVIAVLLDFLTAAGLLRLAADPGWGGIGVAAVVIAIRQVVAGRITSVGVSTVARLHEGHPQE